MYDGTCLLYTWTAFLVLNTLLLSAYATETPHFTEHPLSAVVAPDKAVSLSCVAIPADAVIHWTVNGERVLTDRAAGVTVDGGSLRIAAFRGRKRHNGGGHGGRYRCIAENQVGAVFSEEAVLRAAFIGQFGDDMEDVSVKATEGNVAVIPCTPPKGEPLAVHFEVNNTTIQESAGRYHLMESGNLQISPVKQTDSGIYRCIAVNTLTGQTRRASNKVRLVVIAPVTRTPPRIVIQPPGTNIQVIKGDKLSLECAMEGAPVPVVSWRKYGGHLPEKRAKQILGNLHIEDVQLHDQGTYICRAENGERSPQAAVAMVTVLERPIVSVTPVGQAVAEGSTVTFECHAYGEAKVSTQWMYNAEPLHESNFVKITASSLELRRVQKTQSGMYQCVAENRLGTAVAAARLQVLPPGEITDPDLAAEIAFASSANATETRPSAANESDETEAGGRKRPSGSRGRQAGRWGGRRGGRRKRPPKQGRGLPLGGEERDTGKLVAPSRPRISQLSDTSVKLQWIVPRKNNGLHVTFFKVQFKDVSAGRHQRWRTLQEDISSDARVHVVDGLKTGNTYKFRVLAVFSNKDNLQSANSRKFTLRDSAGTANVDGHTSRLPVGKPTIVEVRAISPTSLLLTWQYVQTETLRGFIVDYWPYDPDRKLEHIQQEKVPGRSKRQHLLSGLQAGTPYSLRIFSYNDFGKSEPSYEVVKTTLPIGGVEPDPYDVRPYPGDRPVVPSAQTPSSTTTMAYPRNSLSTEKSNDLLYLTLGVVLGVMLLLLLIFTVMCACRQRQQRRMMAALEGRNKLDDASRSAYNESLNKHQVPTEMFLLAGLNGKVHNGQHNGHIGAGRANGVPVNRLESEVPERNNSLNELRASLQQVLQPAACSRAGRCSNCDSGSIPSDTDTSPDAIPPMEVHPRVPLPCLPPLPRPRDDAYEPPDYSSIGSRRRTPPALPQRHRPAVVAAVNASPDHIPRSHEWSAHRDWPSSGGSAAAGDRGQQACGDRPAYKHRRRKVASGGSTRDQATNTDLSSGDESVQHAAPYLPSTKTGYKTRDNGTMLDDSEKQRLTSDLPDNHQDDDDDAAAERREEVRLAEEQERLLRVNEYPPSDQDD